MKSHRTQTAAFSLVELSIVLVILGLLTGGILAGQSLIRAAELRAVSTESSRYITAISSFRDKYFGIPGDFNKAVAFGWGSTSGDNDGIIENTAAATGTDAAGGVNEISAFWNHLQNAGLIEGSYTVAAGVSLTPVSGHIPRSKVSSGVWNVIGLNTVGVAGTSTPVIGATTQAASTFYAGTYGNALLLGGLGTSILPTGVLKSEEAWNIDTKMDDGRPDQGVVLTLESQGSGTAGAGCGNQATLTTALAASSYDLTNQSSSACSLVIKTGY